MSFDPFCVRAATNRSRFYETDLFMALYDIRPVVRGHTLIVPKRHIEDLLQLNVKEIADMHKVFGHVVPKVLEIYSPGADSYDISSQVGPYSGRTIPHLHIHILPRTKSDKYQRGEGAIFQDLVLNRTSFTDSEVDAEVKRLRKVFGYKQ